MNHPKLCDQQGGLLSQVLGDLLRDWNRPMPGLFLRCEGFGLNLWSMTGVSSLSQISQVCHSILLFLLCFLVSLVNSKVALCLSFMLLVSLVTRVHGTPMTQRTISSLDERGASNNYMTPMARMETWSMANSRHTALNTAASPPSILSEDIITCATWNIRRKFLQSLPAILSFMDDQNIQIIGLQETDIAESSARHGLAKYSDKYSAFFTYQPGSHSGAGLILTKTLAHHIQSKDSFPGRLITVILAFPHHQLRITSVYWPANADYAQWSSLTKYLNKILAEDVKSNRHSILLGDWNEDKNRQARPRGHSAIDILQLHGLTDISSPTVNTVSQATFYRSQEGIYEPVSKIDGIWTTPSLVNSFRGTWKVSEEGFDFNMTDHVPVLCSFYSHEICPTTILKKSIPKKIISFKEATKEQLEDFIGFTEMALNELNKQLNPIWCTPGSTKETVMLELDLYVTELQLTLINCAQATLPTKTLGRSKPVLACSNPLQKGFKLINKLIYEQSVHQKTPTEKELTQLTEHIQAANLPMPIITAGGLCTAQELKIYRNQLHKAHAKFITIATAKSIEQALKNRHELFSAGSIKRVLNSVLERNTTPISVDRISLNTEEGIQYKAFDPPTVLKGVQNGFAHQFRSRQVSAFKQDSVFQDIFEVDPCIDPGWYSALMDPPTEEEIQGHLNSMRKGKAPGPSGLAVELLQECSSLVVPILKTIFTTCLYYQDIPACWGQKTIFPIPKKEDWAGDITALRPISLSEVLAKLFQKIWTTRLTTILVTHNILKGHNSSVLPGTSTSQALGIIQHVVDQSVVTNTSCYLLLNDIAKAFDSVPMEGLARAFRRLGIPESYIQMRINMHKHMVARVVTAHGLTEPFHIGSAVQQGDCNAPLDWLIFWDPLLCACQKYTKGINFQTKPPLDYVNIPYMQTSISAVAFVDDTTTMATTIEDLQKQISLLMEYQDANDIKSNVKKIAILAFNPPASCPKSLPWGSEGTVQVYNGAHSERILGNYFDCKGSALPTKTAILSATQHIVNCLGHKLISDKITLYIMNRVLLPKLQYLWKTQLLTPSFLEKVDTMIRACVKRKLGLKNSTPNSVLYHPQIYNLTNVIQQHHMDIVNIVLQQLNDNTILGQIARISLYNLQLQCASLEQPLAKPYPLTATSGYFGKAMAILHQYGFSFQSLQDTSMLSPNLHPVEQVLPWPLLRDTRKARASNGIYFIEQLTSVDNSQYLNKEDLKRSGLTSEQRRQTMEIIGTFKEQFSASPNKQFSLGPTNPFHTATQIIPQSTPHKIGSFAFFKLSGSNQLVQIKKIINKSGSPHPLGEVRHLKLATLEDVSPDREMMAILSKTPRRFFLECDGCPSQTVDAPGYCHLKIPLTNGVAFHCEPYAKIHIANAAMFQANLNHPNFQAENVESGYRLLYKIVSKITLPQNIALNHGNNLTPEPAIVNYSSWPMVTITNKQQGEVPDGLFRTIPGENLPISLYTDGSVRNSRQGMGIYCPDTSPPVRLSLYLPPMITSSYIAELGALIIGLLLSGKNIPTIYLDNQAVVTDFCKLTKQKSPILSAQLLKTPSAYMWSLLLNIWRSHPNSDSIKVIWVKGHADNPGNIEADLLAGSPGLLATFNFQHQDTLHFRLLCSNLPIEGNPIKLIKSYFQIINYNNWASQPLFDLANIHMELDHILTYLLLHSGTKPTSLFSTLPESYRRRFRVQLMHKLLPTQKEMRRRLPHVYPNGICRVCGQQEESQDHILCCPKFTAIYKRLLETIAEKLAATCSSKKSPWSLKTKWQELPELNIDQPHPAYWNSSHILRGLIPMHWITYLKEGQTPHQTAYNQIYKTMDEVLTSIHDEVWLVRCDATIDWETAHNISPTHKKMKLQPTEVQPSRQHRKKQEAQNTYPLCLMCGKRTHPLNACQSEVPSNNVKGKIWAAHFTHKHPLPPGILQIPTPAATKARHLTNARLKQHTRPKRPMQKAKLHQQARSYHTYILHQFQNQTSEPLHSGRSREHRAVCQL